MDFAVENSAEVAKKVSLNSVPGGLFGELLTAVNRRYDGSDGSDDDFSTMRVNDS